MRIEKWGVFAIKEGRIIKINRDAKASVYGNYVIIKDRQGIISRYAHLKSIAVNVGQTVQAGAFLGIMGDTGRGIPGPNKHLHVSVYPATTKDPYMGKDATIDPKTYILDRGVYPCNSRPSTDFHQMIGNPPYPHEGLDFSGLDKNIIKGWEAGTLEIKNIFEEFKKGR